MGSVKLKDNVYWVGVSNPELRVFDIIMETKKGTTYNSYLIVDEKTTYESETVLIDKILNNAIRRVSVEHNLCADDMANDIVRYVEENYTRQITLNEIAANMYVSYHHASKIFKRITGKSFLNYLNSVRIEKAKLLCVSAQYRDYEIGRMVGIENAYYF
jgi:YesN/AraC family two-component response regulator